MERLEQTVYTEVSMRITLSNGTRLALPDDISNEVLRAQVELAELEIAEKIEKAASVDDDEILADKPRRGRR
jgi:hypothetical protein